MRGSGNMYDDWLSIICCRHFWGSNGKYLQQKVMRRHRKNNKDKGLLKKNLARNYDIDKPARYQQRN